MKIGIESETLEFKKTTAELKEACISICAMLNKHGIGTLYFGVKPNGEVMGQQVSESSLRDVSRAVYDNIHPQVYPMIEKAKIDGKDIIKVEVNGSEFPYSAFGKYYIRTADEDRLVSTTELENLILDKAYKSKWEKTVTSLTAASIDKKTFKEFYNASIKAARLPKGKYSTTTILEKLGLLADGHLNNAGAVLFANNGPVTLKLAMFATDEKLTFLDQLTTEGNIYNLLEIAENYILRNIRWETKIEGADRIELSEIPVQVVREVLANSFAHAMYGTGIYHEICIHPNMITIFNPGSFTSTYSPSEYAKKNLPSILRNELISKSLYLSNKIERFGSGIKRIDSFCKDAKIKYKFENDEVGCRFIIYRPKIQSDILNVTLNVTLNGTEKVVLALLEQNNKYTREELSDKISKTVRTIQRALDSLKEKGYIRRIGSKRDGYWEVIKH